MQSQTINVVNERLYVMAKHNIYLFCVLGKVFPLFSGNYPIFMSGKSAVAALIE